MKRSALIGMIAVPLALALAGCVSNDSAAPTSAIKPTTSMTATGPTRPPGGPNAAAEDICVKAVQQQTNADGVAIISSEAQATSTLVMLDFPAATAPWRCVYSGARVTEVKPVTG